MTRKHNAQHLAKQPEPEQTQAWSVLVVNQDRSLLTQVQDALEAIEQDVVIEQVRGYLTALGHMAARGAPTVLIGRCEELREALTPTIAALRQVAPRTCLLLLIPPAQEAEAATVVKAGFDGYLLEPLDARLLMNVLRTTQDDQTDVPHGPSGDTLIQLDESLGHMLGKAIGKQASSNPETAAPPVDAVIGGPELGDVDLIEELLGGRRSIRPMALRLIAEHGGLKAVGWATDAVAVPADHVSVPVTWQGRQFGLLHSPPPTTSTQLSSWAAWLARWLTLQQRVNDLWHMALHDELTGVWNRRYFDRFLRMVLHRAARERFRVTLLVLDIDDFKRYNDQYGHAAGDEILCETAKLLQSVVREYDVVARIGGDEFAVIFWDSDGPRRPNSQHPASPIKAARRFQEAICAHKFPKLANEAPGSLTISGGLAGFPWDAQSAENLLERADQMALESKRMGKNAIKIGPGAEQNSDLA